jgi:hypothetical protein
MVLTLTIQPGTIIKGEAGTGANATALLIARGGKLMLREQLQCLSFLLQLRMKLTCGYFGR